MALSDSLEVAIGLSFIFFLASLVLASIHEGIECMAKARGKYLFRGITELFGSDEGRSGESIARAIYRHPTLQGMMRGTVETAAAGNKLPSYLPTKAFVAALLDQAAGGQLSAKDVRASASPTLTRIQQLRLTTEGIDNPQLRGALIHAIEASGGDLEKVHAELERWFEGAMDRVSGWYKRRSQRIIFALGLATALLLNVNTVLVARSLSTSASLREALVGVAQQRERACLERGDCLIGREGAVAELERTNLPIGWNEAAAATVAARAGTPGGMIELFFGYLLTAFAVTLGAPFWFDVLNRLMVIRATVKPTEKSKEEAPQDPQSRNKVPIEVKLPEHEPQAPSPRPRPPADDGDIYLARPEPGDRLFEGDEGEDGPGVGADGAVLVPAGAGA